MGLDERGSQTYDTLDYKMDCAIVLGAEGKGLHDLVAKKCDFLVSIPMLGKVPSLNVSVAAGVVLYEVVRQSREELIFSRHGFGESTQRHLSDRPPSLPDMQGTPLRALILFVLVLILVLPAFAIDREAFTFAKYDLDVRISAISSALVCAAD